MSLYRSGMITFEEAVRQSSNPDDFKLKASGISSASDLSWEDFDKDGDDPDASGEPQPPGQGPGA
jgi:twitching motility protein PilT